jgi:hypothetical protein
MQKSIDTCNEKVHENAWHNPEQKRIVCIACTGTLHSTNRSSKNENDFDVISGRNAGVPFSKPHAGTTNRSTA